mmetsp:Transcript_5483/g.20730  ORF Transcript_5483/g.20730 Transcript_5483/m.20730 type:complete len:237 (+) Transcript_5483:563-1273(+)
MPSCCKRLSTCRSMPLMSASVPPCKLMSESIELCPVAIVLSRSADWMLKLSNADCIAVCFCSTVISVFALMSLTCVFSCVCKAAAWSAYCFCWATNISICALSSSDQDVLGVVVCVVARMSWLSTAFLFPASKPGPSVNFSTFEFASWSQDVMPFVFWFAFSVSYCVALTPRPRLYAAKSLVLPCSTVSLANAPTTWPTLPRPTNCVLRSMSETSMFATDLTMVSWLRSVTNSKVV